MEKRRSTLQAASPNCFFSLPTVMDRTCPKCGKDYSNDVRWKQSLERHLHRKFPCDQPRQVEQEIEYRSLDTIVIPEMNIPADKPMGLVTRWVFGKIMQDHANRCFIKTNVKHDEFYVRVKPDELVVVNTFEFIKLWVNHVFYRLPDCRYKYLLIEDANMDLRFNNWDGVSNSESDAYRELKSAIMQLMIISQGRVKHKNLLIKQTREAMMNTSHTPAPLRYEGAPE